MAFAICNQTISSLMKDSPPFAKVIALGYQDGPTMGVAACADGTTAYRFDLLGIDLDGAYDHAAWDRGKEVRVFGLAPLPSGSFERIVRALTELERPHWPVWVPPVIVPDDDSRRQSEREVVALLAGAGPPRFVVAGPSLLEPLRAAREIDPEAVRPGSDEAWFAWLGRSALQPTTRGPARALPGSA